jgi:hypothetical protein
MPSPIPPFKVNKMAIIEDIKEEDEVPPQHTSVKFEEVK